MNYDLLSIIIQFFIFIATGVYAWFAYGQWKAIRDTLDVTQNQKRPLIMVTPDKPEGWPSSAGPSLSFQFAWSAHNVGEGPAFLTQLWFDVVIALYPVPDKEPGYGKTNAFAEFIIPPNGKHTGRALKHLAVSDILSIQTGEKCILFYGLVDYRDMFNHCHRTKFCSYWHQQGYSPVGPPSYIKYT